MTEAVAKKVHEQLQEELDQDHLLEKLNKEMREFRDSGEPTEREKQEITSIEVCGETLAFEIKGE